MTELFSVMIITTILFIFIVNINSLYIQYPDTHSKLNSFNLSSELNDNNFQNKLSTINRKEWCRFSNGTSIPLGYTFNHSICTLCHCTVSRIIRCSTLQCVSQNCIDNTKPIYKSDQCCSQCKDDVSTNSCEYNGISFPHGVIMKYVKDVIQCWCQSGYIQCQNLENSLEKLERTYPLSLC